MTKYSSTEMHYSVTKCSHTLSITKLDLLFSLFTYLLQEPNYGVQVTGCSQQTFSLDEYDNIQVGSDMRGTKGHASVLINFTPLISVLDEKSGNSFSPLLP
jgi:hypothetical protein